MSDFYLFPGNENNPNIITNIGKYIRSLDADKKWHIKVKPYKKNRSLEQQGYYWAVVLPTIAKWHHEATGKLCSEEVWHETLKPVYVPYTTEEGPDGKVKIYKSTTKLSTVEYNTMFDQICSDFADRGCHIPPPDPNWKKNVRQSKAA